MTLNRGALELVSRQQIRGLCMPIDFFLRSLADTHLISVFHSIEYLNGEGNRANNKAGAFLL